jgi:hypothetical protein
VRAVLFRTRPRRDLLQLKWKADEIYIVPIRSFLPFIASEVLFLRTPAVIAALGLTLRFGLGGRWFSRLTGAE